MANQKDKSLQKLEQRLLKSNTGMNFNQLSKTTRRRAAASILVSISADQKDKSLQKLEERLLHWHMTWGNI